MTTNPSSLQEIIAPAVERTGLLLEETSITGDGDHRTLHVSVDRLEGTEGLDPVSYTHLTLPTILLV